MCVCGVKVLADGLLVDDDQTLESAGLTCAGCDVMVIYTRKEVGAALKEAIHEEDFLHVTIPCHIIQIAVGAFQNCNQVLKETTIPDSVTIIGRLFHFLFPLVSLFPPDLKTEDTLYL